MTILLIAGQASTIIINMYEGMIWMVLPAFLVISNDIFAYVFGKTFGKTPLIELSPKKTVEGFIGGFVSTLVLAFIVTLTNQDLSLLSRHPLLDMSGKRSSVKALPIA